MLLRDGARPIIGYVGRLDTQKGLHLIRHALFHALEHDAQFVLLGSGSEHGDQRGLLAPQAPAERPPRRPSRDRLRRGTRAPDLRGRRPADHAEPLRALRALADDRAALRHRAGRAGRRRPQGHGVRLGLLRAAAAAAQRLRLRASRPRRDSIRRWTARLACGATSLRCSGNWCCRGWPATTPGTIRASATSTSTSSSGTSSPRDVASLPEYVDGLPNLSGSEDAVERAIAEPRDRPVFLDESRIPFDRIRSACAIALHMHQPLTPAGGDDLHTAALIGNLQTMAEHPGDRRQPQCACFPALLRAHGRVHPRAARRRHCSRGSCSSTPARCCTGCASWARTT